MIPLKVACISRAS